MAVDLLITYKAEVDDLTNKLKVVIDRLDQMEKESVSAAKGLDKTTVAADKLDKELSSTGNSTKKATDNIKNFSKTAKTELNGLSSSVKSIASGIAAGLGVAFSVDAIIQFSKASINAFLEAQENAEKLRFTITQVGGESEAAFQRLIDQSAQLQDITIFSDDSLQQAQNALATFGLTANQIEELLPLLTDFASATKTDIVQAAQQVGAGLQGAGREFKKYGIEVSATATAIENLSAITDGFGKFQGSAAKETETLTGQLKQQANAADDLQETIGEKLAPAFVKFKLAAFDAINTIIESFRSLDEIRKESADNFNNSLAARVEAELIGRNEINNLGLLKNAQTELLQTEQELLKNREEIRKLDVNDQRLITVSKQNDELNKTVEILNDIIAREAKRAADAERTLTAEQLKTKQLTELNTLLKENQAINDVVAQSNIQLINKEIEARKKLEDEAKKNANVRIKTNEEIIRQLEKITDTNISQLEKIFIASSVGPQTFRDAVREASEEVEKLADAELEESINRQNQARIDSFKNANAEIVDDTRITNEQIIDISAQLFNELNGLYNAYANQRVTDIQSTTNTEIENLDKQLQANEEALQNRRLSEREAANEKIRIEAEKVKAEQEADKKIRAIKRQQAIINKIAALADIAISTAKNVASFPALTAFYLAIGAAQAAIVAAQPIPYKKGSKNTKEGLARVGEEGEEIVFIPGGSKVLPAKQTQTYGSALDAMFDNRFDKWVIDNYAPKLIAQQKQHKESESKSYAKNIADSLTVNVASAPMNRRKDRVTMDNIEELAEAIVRSSFQSPYRR